MIQGALFIRGIFILIISFDRGRNLSSDKLFILVQAQKK